MNPLLVTLTTNRAGTTFLYFLFKRIYGSSARIEHEALTAREARLRRLFRCYEAKRQGEALADPVVAGFLDGIERTLEVKPVLLFGNTLSHLAPLFIARFGGRVRLLGLSRHPIAMAGSMYVMTDPAWWRDIPLWERDPHGNKLTPFDPPAQYPSWAASWPTSSLFEKILYQYLERMAYALEVPTRYPEVPSLCLRSEDLFRGPRQIEMIMDLAGLPRMDPTTAMAEAPRNPIWKRRLEARPLGDEWRSYDRHADLLELGARLGYDLSAGTAERLAAKYQLPGGFASRLRHATRYWQVRSRVAGALRSARLLGPPRANKGVEPE